MAFLYYMMKISNGVNVLTKFVETARAVKNLELKI